MNPESLKESAELILAKDAARVMLSKAAYDYLCALRDNPDTFIADVPDESVPTPIGVVLLSPGSYPSNADIYIDGELAQSHRIYLLNYLFWSSIGSVQVPFNETLWCWLFDTLNIKEHYFNTTGFEKYSLFTARTIYKRVFNRGDIFLTIITFAGLDKFWKLDPILYGQYNKQKLTNIYKYGITLLSINYRMMDLSMISQMHLHRPQLQDPNPEQDPEIDERFIIEVVTNDAIEDPPPPVDVIVCETCLRLGTDYCIKEKQTLLKESGVEFNPDMEDLFAELDEILNQ